MPGVLEIEYDRCVCVWGGGGVKSILKPHPKTEDFFNQPYHGPRSVLPGLLTFDPSGGRVHTKIMVQIGVCQCIPPRGKIQTHRVNRIGKVSLWGGGGGGCGLAIDTG